MCTTNCWGQIWINNTNRFLFKRNLISHNFYQPQTPYSYTVKGSTTHYVDNNTKKTPKLHSVQPSHGHFNPSFGSSFLQSSGQEYSGQPFPHKPEQKSAHHHNNNKVNKENIHTAHVIICDVNIHLAVSFFLFHFNVFHLNSDLQQTFSKLSCPFFALKFLIIWT